MWDVIVGTLSVLAFAMSSIVLWRQEFGFAHIKCTVGPKIWIYHEESKFTNRMLARAVIAATFTNVSPRGGTVEQLVLSWQKKDQEEKTLVGWMYEAEIREVDLNNTDAVFKRKMAGNPFHISAKTSITKYLLFDLNSIDKDSDGNITTIGPVLRAGGEWKIRILGWSPNDNLFSISSNDTITFDDLDRGIFAEQQRNKAMASNIFLVNNRVKKIEVTSVDLPVHYKSFH